MAQLPPKVPSITTTPNWPDFSHQKLDGGALPPSINPHHGSSWMDEFLDFSSSRRGSHRRSMSDSIAFLEAPMVEECRRSSASGNHHNADFERFDDDQLMSMFNDDVVVGGPTMSCSNPSSPSDHNSINDVDDKHGPSDHLHQMQLLPKSEPDEEDDHSSCKSEGFNSLHATTPEDPTDKIVDPKRIKRILANRQSAQRSRVRKLQYISELERSVTSLQAEVSVLSPRVAFLDHQRLVLNVDNSVLKQRIAALAQDKLFKDDQFSA
ncbi:hypothetical protein ACS0TY_032583 [Phlomoides rotata]